MSYTCFDVDIADNIAHVVLKRPEKRNSMNIAFWNELPAIISAIDNEVRARVIVISSTGPHFCSGLDLQEFMSSETLASGTDRESRIRNGATFYQNVQKMQASLSSLENCRMPVLVAIQGGCLGGAVDLVTACDMRYATSDAFFAVEEVNIGMTADVGTLPRLAKLIPEGVVREMCYTGQRVAADAAQSVGLVNRVYEDQEAMLADVMRIAKEIAAKAPLAVYGCKRMINYSRDHSTADSLDYVGIWNASMLQTEEIQEAIMARMEKREGNFVDLPKNKPTVG